MSASAPIAGGRSFTHLQAVMLALTGYTFWVLADASMKLAGRSPLPASEIVGGIGFFEMLLLLTLSMIRRQPRLLWPKSPWRQIGRSCLDLGNNLCVVIAVRHLPLALFYILVFCAPMATAALAALFLKETLRWKQALAILVGFTGVLIAVDPLHATRPGGWVGYLACLVCVTCFSLNIVWSRVLTQRESPESLVFSSAVLMTVVGLFGWLLRTPPVTVQLGATLLVTAVFCILGSTCFFWALRSTSAATVSQFHYSQLLTGTLVAYLGWHERPTLPMFAGTVLIIAAGVYTAAVPSPSPGAPGRVSLKGEPIGTP